MTTQDVTLASLVNVFNTDSNSIATVIKSANLATGTPAQGQVPVYQSNGTINWAIAGAIPAGVTGQIQFNNNGALGASANLAWDNTNNIFQTNIVKSLTGQNLSLRTSTNIIQLANDSQNFISITGVATGQAPTISTTASADANVNIALVPKGLGGIQLGTSTTVAPLFVANSATQSPTITLSAGNAGNILTSAGAEKTPYWSSSVALTSGSVTNAPQNPTDIARLTDIQLASAGLSPKNPVGIPVHIAKVAVAGTYTNNTGYGTATLTGNTQLVIATATPAVGDDVLLVSQANAIQNGSYSVIANSALGFTLRRTNITISYGNFWVATAIDANNYGEQWQNTTTGTIVIGTTDINYTIFGIITYPNLQQVTARGNSTTLGLSLGSNSSLSFTDDQATPNTVQLKAPLTLSANYTLRLPINQGLNNQTIVNDGTGTLSWATLNTGTVTSVGLTLPTPFSVVNSPITSSGNIVATWGIGQIPVANLGSGTPDNTRFLRGDGTWAVVSATGSVTSVGLSAPNAFTVTGSPVTSAGTLALGWGTGQVPVANLGTGTPTSTNFLRGDGSWNKPRLDGLTDVLVNEGYDYVDTGYFISSINDTTFVITLTVTPTAGVFAQGNYIRGSTGTIPTGVPVQIVSVSGANITLVAPPSTYGLIVGNRIYKGTVSLVDGAPLVWNATSGLWVGAQNLGTIGQWYTGTTVPTNVSGATVGNYYWNSTTNLSYLLSSTSGTVQNWTPQPNLDGYVASNADKEIRRQLITYNTTTSSLQTRFALPGDTTPFASQTIAAGQGLFWDTANTVPRLNAQFNTGLGWVMSIFVSFRVTSGTVTGWTLGSTLLPRFRKNGQVTATTGFSVGTRNWSSFSNMDNVTFFAQAYQTWNNSFSDALPVTLATAEDSSRFTVQTAPLTYGMTPTQTDGTIKALFGVGNPTQTDAVASIVYDDNAGAYEYQRAQPSTLEIDLQAVLTAGNNATSSIFLVDNIISPTTTTTLTNNQIIATTISTLGNATNPNYITMASVPSGSTPEIKSAGSQNTNLNISPSGSGSLLLGNVSSFAGLSVQSSAQSSVNLTVNSAATNANLVIAPKGTGSLTLGETVAGGGIQLSSGGITTFITTVGAQANYDLSISPKGNGAVYLGNYFTYSGFAVGGSSIASARLLAVSAALNADLVLIPKGTGSFYPIGSSLSATFANQPKIFVAQGNASSSLSAGALGQAMMSNALSGAPFWGNAILQNTALIQYTIQRIQNIGSGSFAVSPQSVSGTTITQSTIFNNAGITINTDSTIQVSQTGMYRVSILGQLLNNNNYSNNFYAYISVTNLAAVYTATGAGSGVSCTLLRPANARSGDTQSYHSVGYAYGVSTLNIWAYWDTVANVTGATSTATLLIEIVRLS